MAYAAVQASESEQAAMAVDSSASPVPSMEEKAAMFDKAHSPARSDLGASYSRDDNDSLCRMLILRPINPRFGTFGASANRSFFQRKFHSCYKWNSPVKPKWLATPVINSDESFLVGFVNDNPKIPPLKLKPSRTQYSIHEHIMSDKAAYVDGHDLIFCEAGRGWHVAAQGSQQSKIWFLRELNSAEIDHIRRSPAGSRMLDQLRTFDPTRWGCGEDEFGYIRDPS